MMEIQVTLAGNGRIARVKIMIGMRMLINIKRWQATQKNVSTHIICG